MFIFLKPVRPVEADANLILDWLHASGTSPEFLPGDSLVVSSVLAGIRSGCFSMVGFCAQFACVKGVPRALVCFMDPSLPNGTGQAVEVRILLGVEDPDSGLEASIAEAASRHVFVKGARTVLAEAELRKSATIRAYESMGFRFRKYIEPKDGGEARVLLERTPPVEDRSVADRVTVIAEAGANWRMGTPERDLAMGYALVDAAADAGADIVKFQTYRPETVYVGNAGSANYLSDAGIDTDISDIFHDLSMPYEMIPKLAERCQARGIEFMSTPFSKTDMEAIDPYVSRHKLASYEISHAGLIRCLAETGKPLIMSTGAATLEDIDWAVDYFHASGGSGLVLMQCTAKYPAPLASVNLRSIPAMVARYGLPVGLSDHSRDPITAPVGAVALGATVIEKHFTLHNALPGPDHPFAVTATELKAMVDGVRNMEEARGKGGKDVLDEEQELRSFAQRGVQASKPVDRGEVLSLGVNMEILRPGKQRKGMHPRSLDKVEGLQAIRDIPVGDGIHPEDVSEEEL